VIVRSSFRLFSSFSLSRRQNSLLLLFLFPSRTNRRIEELLLLFSIPPTFTFLFSPSQKKEEEEGHSPFFASKNEVFLSLLFPPNIGEKK